MGRGARLGLVSLLLVAGGVAAVLIGGGEATAPAEPFAAGPSPGTPLPVACLPLPAAKPGPRWLPRDLPQLEGTYVSEVPPRAGRIRRVVLTANGTLDEFVRQVLDGWTAAGWELGRGEREPGEAEATFTNARLIGFFRARSIYCDQAWTEVLIGFAPREAEGSSER